MPQDVMTLPTETQGDPATAATPRRKLRSTHAVLGAVLTALVLSMMVMAYYDYEWTLWLSKYRIRWIDDFLGRTIFEGEGYGGSDSAIVYMIVFVVLYFAAWLTPGHKRLYRWRPQLGFIVLSGLACGVYMVHSLKWFMGRARPRLVIKKGLAYTEWYQIGPHYVTEGIYRGSFPSGHTAAVLLFLTLAYILIANRKGSLTQRLLGWLWGGASIGYCLFMAVGRAMSLGHWLADCVFSIFFGWALMHGIYFWVMRVPQQIDYYRTHLKHADTPKLWEIQFGWLLFLTVLGGLAVGLGLRSFWEQPLPWLALLIPPGVFMIVYFGRKLLRFHKRVLAAFSSINL